MAQNIQILLVAKRKSRSKRDMEYYSYRRVEEKFSLCRRAICKWRKEFHGNNNEETEKLKDSLNEEMKLYGPIIDETKLSELNKLNAKLLQAY